MKGLKTLDTILDMVGSFAMISGAGGLVYGLFMNDAECTHYGQNLLALGAVFTVGRNIGYRSAQREIEGSKYLIGRVKNEM